MLRLSWPVVLGEIGWVAMGIVDVMMVGRIDAESIGAVSIGRALFMVFAVTGLGLLLGLDTVIAHAFGAGDRRETHLMLLHGVYLALAVALPLTIGAWAVGSVLAPLGIDPRIESMARLYLDAVAWSMAPMLLYFTFRRYLQAINVVRPVMIALISANLVNVLANWVMIFGKLGLPALGATGAAWATVLAMTYLALFLGLVIAHHDRETGRELGAIPLRPETARLRRLVGLGLPAAMQLLLEVGVFAVVTALAGRLAAAALAAHQIALNAASVTFMVPLGISSATAVRVGQAIGRRDGEAAARAGWAGLAIGTGFMAIAAATFVIFPAWIVRAFSDDPAVLAVGIVLLHVAAAFQLFDGIQVVAIGALRGAGDTRTPMVWAILGYWGLALPIGWWLCFRAGYGAPGLWIGLSTGLIVVGAILLGTWARRAAGGRLAVIDPPPPG